MKLTLWKLITNYKDILKLIELVRSSYADKTLTKGELDVIALEITALLAKLGLVK